MSTKTKPIWLPDQKVSDRAKDIAWTLFINHYRAALEGHEKAMPGTTEEVYRACLEKALVVECIENEDVPRQP